MHVYRHHRVTRHVRIRDTDIHAIPFHSIRAAHLASKLSPMFGSLATPRCAGFMSLSWYVHACGTCECVYVLTLRRRQRQDPIGDRLPALLKPGMPFPFGNQLGSRTGYEPRYRARTAENYWELSKIDTRTGRVRSKRGTPRRYR